MTCLIDFILICATRCWYCGRTPKPEEPNAGVLDAPNAGVLDAPKAWPHPYESVQDFFQGEAKLKDQCRCVLVGKRRKFPCLTSLQKARKPATAQFPSR